MSLAGKTLYHVWHRPAGWLRDLIDDGGPFERRRTERGRAEMEAFAMRLPAPTPVGDKPVQLHLLSGRRFWYQTAFCLWTFARHAERPLAPVIYDDGTLGDHGAKLLELFPLGRIVTKPQMQECLDERLPVDRFPTLRERWQNYPNLRKLVDPHLGSTGWKLVIDSDLLFFRTPKFLLKWHDRPSAPLHAVDCETSYGYSRPLLEELAGAPLADFVNVGLTGLQSETLDWERLEHWCAELIARERTSYYLEQALVAMLVANRPCAIAPASDYLTKPEGDEARACRAVMHHYVADSKRWYFQQNWRTALG